MGRSRSRSRSRSPGRKRRRSSSRSPPRGGDRGGHSRRRESPPGRDGYRDRERDRERERERDREREREREQRDRERIRVGAPGQQPPGPGDRRDGDRRDDRRMDDRRPPPDRRDDRDGGRDDRDSWRRRDGFAPPFPGPPPAAPGPPPPEEERPKRAPLSIEELAKKRAQETAADAKPVFLSKAQREALAKQAEEEAEAARKAAEAEKSGISVRDWARKKREEEDRRRDEERRKRAAERDHEKELEMIKMQYLGAKKEKKRIAKPSEKMKFVFDWSADEDTSRDLNPIYANPHEATLQFGRGLRAGIDRKEQKKELAQHESMLIDRIRKANGTEETAEQAAAADRAARRRAGADKYDSIDMRRDRHWTDKKLEEMTERDWRILREDFAISYSGGRCPNPFRTWEESNLPELILRAVEKVGYKKPSPIQMASIPVGLLGRDCIGIAETGSGKTAAFVIPMLAYIMKQPVMRGVEAIEAEGPYSIIMAPTRELAQQIEEETAKFAHYLDYRVVSLVGGQSIEEQGFKLRKGAEIVVGTPGRFKDCIERRYTVLHQCNYIVLDEADRMIDLGLEKEVLWVLEAMPSSNLKPVEEDAALDANKVYRTTYMFSATMPPAVERLARTYMRNPVKVQIGSAGKAADLITQTVLMCRENEKPGLLEREVEKARDTQTMVFVNTRATADFIQKALAKLGKSCTVLHSGKTQDVREQSILGFRQKKYQFLIATDVAGRGIDVPDVGLVINYEMPENIEPYTHRIGRTGRAGKKGTAVSFVTTERNTGLFFDLKNLLQQSGNVVPHELAHHQASKQKPMKGVDRKDAMGMRAITD